MCDFCEGKFIPMTRREKGGAATMADDFGSLFGKPSVSGVKLIRAKEGGLFLAYDNSAKEYGRGLLKIAYCPLCGRKLESEDEDDGTAAKHSVKDDLPAYPPELEALADAVEPLHDYMLKYGDPRTCVTVTQFGARLEHEGIFIPFVKGGCDKTADFEREIKSMMGSAAEYVAD